MAAGAANPRKNSPREWAIAIGGLLALAAALVWLLRGTADSNVATDSSEVDTLAPPLAINAAPDAAVWATIPQQMPRISASSVPTDLALAGLRTGPDGGMAIVTSAGRQYLLRPGRSLPGGLRLLRVEPGRAILAGPGGEQVLAFPDAPRQKGSS